MSKFTLNLANKGLLITSPGDLLPPGFYSNFLNMTSHRDGYIENRLGSSRVNGSALPAAIHSQARMLSEGEGINYQGAGSLLYRGFSSIASGFSGNPLTSEDYQINTSLKPHMIFFDSSKIEKDDGASVTNFGIAGALTAIVAAAAAATQKTIDLFEYASDVALNAAWTAASATLTTDAVDPKQGTYSAQMDVAASTRGTMTRTVALNLAQFSAAGDSDDNDYIHFWVKVDDPAALVEIRLLFDVDPATNTFTRNYYWKSILPNDITPGVDNTVTARTARDSVITRASLQNLDELSFDDPRVEDLDYEELAPGVDQWTEFFIKKSDFQRVGSHSNDWANVAAVRISVETNSVGGISFNIDDGIMQGGTEERLDGDYDWIVRYRNKNTNIVSPFSPVMAAQTTITKTKASLTSPNPRDVQATHVELYRRGGTLPNTFQFVKELAVGAYTGTTIIVDGVADDALGEVADLTQIEMANLTITNAPISKSVRKTVNNGAAYTDYTSAAGDANTATHVDISSLNTSANGDWLVVGADDVFRRILIDMDSAVNAATAAITVEYWDGSAWTAVTNASDGTAVSGVTFARDGQITFDLPNDWEKNTLDSVEAYYIRLSVSSILSASVLIDEIRLSTMEMSPTVGAVHADRCWLDDSRHSDRVVYSRRFAIEEFETDGYIVVSKGGDPVVRPFPLDDQLFVFTKKTVLRVIGSSAESFQAIGTGSEVGLFSKWCICKGAGFIFYRAHDGIYALMSSGNSEKISEGIDNLFHGIAGGAEGNLQPVDHAEASSERLEYFGNKLRFAYQATNGTRYELIYDRLMRRWEPSDRPVTSYLRLDDSGLLYAGQSDGYVYELETGQDDAGTDITINFRTGYMDVDVPDQEKFITEMVVDCDLGGGSVTAYLDLDNGSTSESTTLTGTGRQSLHFPMTEEIRAKNFAFRVTSDNAGVRMRFYKVTFYYDVGPPEVRRMDSLETDFGYTRWKYIRRIWVSGKTADTVTLQIYVDEVLKHTTTFTITPTSGWKKVELRLPPGLKGKVFRFILTSPSAFKIFRDQSDVEWHPMAGERGYARAPLLRVA